jgi:Fe-coproporphyrin III synthase
MASRLDGLRRAEIPFGFIFTLTQHNIHELSWVVEFALREGASLVQVHPLEEIGRAQSGLSDWIPNEVELAWAFAEVARLREVVGDQLTLQFDVLRRTTLRRQPGFVFAETSLSPWSEARIADVISPLVVEADGTVVPLKHGLPRSHALGNVRDRNLAVLAREWLSGGGLERFNEMCRQVSEEIAMSEAPRRLVDWYGEIQRRSSRREDLVVQS